MRSVSIGEKGKLGWRKFTSALAAIALGVTGITAAAVVSGSDAVAEDAPGTSEATAIHKPGTHNQKQGYEGKAWIDYDQEIHILNTKAGDKALPGNKIFLQWMNGKGVVSPIYYTLSDPEGNFYFDLSEPVVDGLGVKHEYILAGDANFKVRVWAENPDPEKFTVVKTGDIFGASFHTRTKRVNESWDFTAGINRIVGGQVVFQERPYQFDWLAKPEAEWTHAPSSDGIWNDGGIYGTARGQVWWQVDDPGGSLAYKYDYNPNRGDRAATEIKMVASYLNDEVTRELDTWKEANKGYTVEMMRQEQIRLFTEYQAEHGVGSHIAETVVAPVTADSQYYIPFQGLWGRTAYNDGGVPAGKTWGELTGEHRHDDVLLWNTLAGFNRRHFNTDYMYVFPIINGKQDLWRNAFNNNVFSKPNEGNLGDGSPTMLASHNLGNVSFAFLSPNPEHDVTNYDNSNNIAVASDVAKSETTGLAPFTEYTIQWFKTDKDVTMVPVEGASCTFQTATDGSWRTDAGELASCDLTVPDIGTATTFVSAVYGGTDVSGVNLLADSFLAIPGYYVYEPQEDVVKAKLQTSPPIFDNPNTGFTEVKPEGATFTFADPDAAAALQLGLDAATGVVTWPVDTQYVGKLSVPVEMKASIESYTAGMGSRSMPSTGPKAVSDGKNITLSATAEFVLTPPNVSYDAATVERGKTADVLAVIADNDGNDVELPAETTFALGEGAPAWATIDATTGKISVAPGADVVATDYDVPVVVTFKDVTDPVKVTAKVTVTAGDSDGDGVTDPKDPANPQPGEDQCAGTPAGAQVDANGCAVVPTIEDPDPITGTVNEEITPIEVPVTNNGGFTELECTAEGLPAGLTVGLNEAGTACVISGTPTEEVTDQDVTITVTGKTPETGTDGKPVTPTPDTGSTTATIGAQPDGDTDGVPDAKDQCAGTPAGAQVDANGCA
ncbi:MAG: Rib/alpha-like domain-containing protein, partial [Actinomycetaceae bacterium]|nr:Rib/alpha-like domain-containing protein [Actinomycetaceae bacterium]